MFYSQAGMLKAIRRHIACPKALTQLFLTLSFLPSYSSHGKSACRLYFTTPLRGNTSSGLFQSVCLTQEKSIAQSHKKYINFSSAYVSPRYRGHRALQVSVRDMLPIPILRPQGKNNALCGVNEWCQKGHWHQRFFWDVDSRCTRLPMFPHLVGSIALTSSEVQSPSDHLPFLAWKMG